MVVAYIVAALVSTAYGSYKAVGHPSLPYWQRWDPVAVRVACVPVLLLFALAGVAITGLAFNREWVPLEEGAGRQWFNGAVYGMAAVALLRLDITSFGLANFAPARELLRVGLERFEKQLDDAVAKAVPRRLGSLRPTTLCRVVWRLYAKHGRSGLDEQGVEQVAEWLLGRQRAVLAAENAAIDPPPPEVMRAEEELRHYCEVLIVECRDATVPFGDTAPLDDDD